MKAKQQASEDRAGCSVHLAEDGQSVIILDQRKLRNRQETMELRTAEEFCDAIKTLAVRGAPAIGICAGYGMYIQALVTDRGIVYPPFDMNLKKLFEKRENERPESLR